MSLGLSEWNTTHMPFFFGNETPLCEPRSLPEIGLHDRCASECQDLAETTQSLANSWNRCLSTTPKSPVCPLSDLRTPYSRGKRDNPCRRETSMRTEESPLSHSVCHST